MHLKTITELLTLPNFQVVSVLEQNETSIHLYVDLVESVAKLQGTLVSCVSYSCS